MQRKPVYELPDTTESGLNLLEYTENLLELYNPDSHHCERCGKKIWSSGKVSSYSRGFIWPCNGKPMTDTIQIPIHLCEKCGKSADGSGNRDGDYMHAILPQVLIPFSAYTLPFVFTVLREYACPERSCTVVQLCEHWQIAVSTLYSWIRRYKDQYDAWADSLHSIRKQEEAAAAAGMNPRSVIRNAIAAALNCIFSEARDLPGKFFQKITFSFIRRLHPLQWRKIPDYEDGSCEKRNLTPKQPFRHDPLSYRRKRGCFMNYFEHFGLSLDPFLKNAMQGHQSFLSRDFHNASEILRSGVERNGVVLLTAGPGLGKSHAIDRFLSGLDTSRRSGTYVCPPFVSVTEFYRMIAQELGLDPTGNKQRLQCRIKTHIYSVYKRGRPIVLVVDEAQDLKFAVLEELHIFLNFDHDTTDAFTLILSGGPALNEIIDTTEKLASLKQRITNHYDFKGLSDEEIPLYLKHKLEFAGGNTLILDDDALRCLCTASCGISRTIDHIMTDALAYGAQTGRNRIDAEIMQVAIDNQSLVSRKRFSTKASYSREHTA